MTDIYPEQEYTINIGDAHTITFKGEVDNSRSNSERIYIYVANTTIKSIEIAENNLNEIIDKIAALCVTHNLFYDSHHNHLFYFFNGKRSKEIRQQIDEAIAKKTE